MRFLAALVTLCGVASADSARGRYTLEPKVLADAYDFDQKTRLDPCGPDALEFLSKLGTLRIDARGRDILVNGEVWPLWKDQPEGMTIVVRDDLLKGLLVAINFERHKRGRAIGSVGVVALGPKDTLKCGNARVLSGRYEK